jgi:hypothetical protein
MDRRFASDNAVDVSAPVFSFWATITDKGRPNRIASPEGKLNDLRHLALFGAVAAANAEAVVRTREGTAVRGTAVHTNYNWDHVYWHSHKLRKLELGSTAIGTW